MTAQRMEGEMELYCYKGNGSIHNIQHNGLDEAQLESRLPREISITSDMQMIPLLCQKAKRN